MSETDEDVTVDESGVSVRKTLNDHQFETLAVVFDVRSEREDAAGVTLIDAVPDDVPVDDIGFHPEYGGEHWHADGDRVVFSRTFEPGEQYTTVYGVRDFDGDRAGLLTEPSVEVGAPEVHDQGEGAAEATDEVEGAPEQAAEAGGAAAIDDLVTEEDSDIVREVIAGERDTLPGLGGEGAAGAGASAGGEAGDVGEGPAEAAGADVGASADEDEASKEDVTVDEDEAVDEEIASLGGGTSAGADADAGAGEEIADLAEPEDEPDGPAPADAAGDETGVEGTDDDDAEAGVGSAVADAGGDVGPTEDAEVEASGGGSGEATADDGAVEEAEAARADDDEITVPVTGGIARVLAKELRAGNVSHDDRRLLREELLPDEGSTDARVKHLQNQVADLAAYTDALEAFLDEEGGAQAALDRIESRVDSLAAEVEAVEQSIEGVDDTVESLRDDVEDVEDDVDVVEDEVDEVADEVESVSGDVERVTDDVERIDGDLRSVRDEVDRIDEVDRRLGGVEDDVSAIHDELEELATFRDRLSSVFGPGGAGMGRQDEGNEENDG